ncbi:MAG TPA: NAD-dependent epimerase/dehydratase family protein, partial [Bacteroidetes bacterium]|nr:NAD-dependent epimerase/dehydratase family protein [Bacteroidota bacterium]
MNILLTGGAGFIGSHVGDMLIADGHQVTILDDLSTGRRSNVPPGAEFIEEDIRSRSIHALWADRRFDTLVHLAAQMDVRKSVKDPVFDADVNIRGTLNLVEAGRENGLGRVVFTSTGGAGYDDNVPFPTPETVPARPVSPYGIAKIATEMYLRYYHLEHSIPYVALRLGNVYGPRQNPHGEAGVIAIFSQRLLAGQTALINGDGLQTRDYVYVGDVADAVRRALSYNGVGSLNVGTSIETSVVELFRMIRDAAGVDVEEVHGPGKPGEVRRSCLANDLIRREMGWEPRVPLR